MGSARSGNRSPSAAKLATNLRKKQRFRSAGRSARLDLLQVGGRQSNVVTAGRPEQKVICLTAPHRSKEAPSGFVSSVGWFSDHSSLHHSPASYLGNETGPRAPNIAPGRPD